MQNDMRDRLIDLINQDNCPSPYICDERCKYSHLVHCIGDRLADHLIENDVVPVVRCKYCKHYKKINYDDVDPSTCEITTKRQQPYDYCSYGERS